MTEVNKRRHKELKIIKVFQELKKSQKELSVGAGKILKSLRDLR